MTRNGEAMKKVHKLSRMFSVCYDSDVVRPVCKVDNKTLCYSGSTDWNKVTCKRCKDINEVKRGGLIFEEHCTNKEVEDILDFVKRRKLMHYRNGREAKNGDKIIQLDMNNEGKVIGFGVLTDAVAGNDYCNGQIATLPTAGACLVDCLHVEDLAVILKEKGLDKRPVGK